MNNHHTHNEMSPDDLLLHSFVSGELPAAEMASLIHRLLNDPAMRQQVEELEWVDDLARQDFYSGMAGANERNNDLLSDEKRHTHVQQILRLTAGDNRLPPRRPHVFTRRIGMLAAWASAAAAMIIAGMLLGPIMLRQPEIEPDAAGNVISHHQPAPIDAERVARLKSFKQALGNVAVISPVGDGAGNWLPVSDSFKGDIIMRITIVRLEDDDGSQWAMDCLLPQGRSIELIMGGGAGWQPESVIVTAGQPEYDSTPVAVQAVLAPGVQISQTAQVAFGLPQRVAEIKSGHMVYQIHVQATSLTAGSEVY